MGTPPDGAGGGGGGLGGMEGGAAGEERSTEKGVGRARAERAGVTVVDRSVDCVRVTGAPDSRRILRGITVYNYDTTHLQENPQRLG